MHASNAYIYILCILNCVCVIHLKTIDIIRSQMSQMNSIDLIVSHINIQMCAYHDHVLSVARYQHCGSRGFS